MDEGFGAERRFCDFVEIAGDFAWEVDAAGRFVFAAPALIHGWPASSLVGRAVGDFVVDPEGVKAFTATAPLAAEPVGWRDAAGGVIALAVWARPVLDAAGQWIGARGIARDAGDFRAQEIALNAARLRDGLCRHVVRALRDEPQAEAALEAALAALGLAVGATGGAILRRGADGWRPAAAWGVKLPPTALALVRDAVERGEGSALMQDGAQLAAHAVVYRRESKGAVLLWRRNERAAFDARECSLLADVADHVGIALAQLEARERIDQLSRTDQLTGLANRGAFFDEFARRLSRIDRGRPAAALLYVDVVNLKLVNASRGPEAGDTALAALAALLREYTRPGDLIARFGAGEFVLWIERIDVSGARVRAAALRAAARRLAERVGCADLPFGVSVGVAPFDPLRGETIMQLVLRAAADADRGDSGNEKGGEPWPASLPA